MKNSIIILSLTCLILSCKESEKTTVDSANKSVPEVIEVPIESEQERETSTAELKKELTDKGYQIFDYVDEKTKDTILMQQYFIAFLKRGAVRNQNEEEANRLQTEHLAHLGKMYELGYADISGPFGDDGDIRGITIYNVPTLEMADSLANADPMVKAGRLQIEIHPWWAAKGFPLR